jgi:hypothetical protein
LGGKSCFFFNKTAMGDTCLTLEDDPIGCAETSVRNYQYLQRNDPEVCSSQDGNSRAGVTGKVTLEIRIVVLLVMAL